MGELYFIVAIYVDENKGIIIIIIIIWPFLVKCSTEQWATPDQKENRM